MFIELSKKAKDSGLLSLEDDVEFIDDPLIKKGLQLVIDGLNPKITKSILKSQLNKELRNLKDKYAASIECILAIQWGENPEIIKERLDSAL